MTTDKTGVWVSSDPTKATVSATGLVTGVLGGTTTITFTSNDGGFVATATGTVVSKATAVTLNVSTFNMLDAHTYQLSTVFTPSDTSDQTGVWTSSAPSKATVSSTGLVTSISGQSGSVTITFTSNDGGFVASAVATISLAVHVTSVSLNKSTDSINFEGTDQLVATVLPSNATDKTGVWASSNTAIATVDQSGNITTVAAGNCNVTFTTNDGSFVGSCAVTIAYDSSTVYFATTGDTVTFAPTLHTSTTSTATVYWSDGTNGTVTWTGLNGTITKSGLGSGVHSHRVVFGTPASIATFGDGNSSSMNVVWILNLNAINQINQLNMNSCVNLTSIGRIDLLTKCYEYDLHNAIISPTVADQMYADMIVSNATQFWGGYFPTGSIASHANRVTLNARGWTGISTTP